MYIDLEFVLKMPNTDELSPTAPIDLISFLTLSDSYNLSFTFLSASSFLVSSLFFWYESTPIGKQKTDWEVNKLLELFLMLSLAMLLLNLKLLSSISVIAPLELTTCFDVG